MLIFNFSLHTLIVYHYWTKAVTLGERLKHSAFHQQCYSGQFLNHDVLSNDFRGYWAIGDFRNPYLVILAVLHDLLFQVLTTRHGIQNCKSLPELPMFLLILSAPIGKIRYDYIKINRSLASRNHGPRTLIIFSTVVSVFLAKESPLSKKKAHWTRSCKLLKWCKNMKRWLNLGGWDLLEIIMMSRTDLVHDMVRGRQVLDCSWEAEQLGGTYCRVANCKKQYRSVLHCLQRTLSRDSPIWCAEVAKQCGTARLCVVLLQNGLYRLVWRYQEDQLFCTRIQSRKGFCSDSAKLLWAIVTWQIA